MIKAYNIENEQQLLSFKKSLRMNCDDGDPTSSFRKWWQVALADAAGALGGVASGMQICKHWLCSVFGGVIGAAGASVSVARISGSVVQQTIAEIPISFQNKFEMVGNIHNTILRDFYLEGYDPDPELLYDYIIKHKEKYGFDEVPVTREMYRKLVYTHPGDSYTEEEALAYLYKIIPPSISHKSEFLSTVKSLLAIPTLNEYNLNAIGVEEEFFKGKRFTENESMLYEAFFSTLRHSANLWY